MLSKNSLIRIILCLVIMIILLLGIFDVIPESITFPISAVSLIAIDISKGLSFLKSGQKKQAIVVFVIAGIVAVIVALALAMRFLLTSELAG